MFNNPFGSFHDTVAEAREEREQLDRLLTISTPRERFLVVAIFLVLLSLGAWLFLGSVTRSVVVDGVLLGPAGNPVSSSDGSVQALVWVEDDIVPQIEVGMAAMIKATGAAGALEGKVTSVVALPLTDGLEAVESTAPLSAHRIAIELDEGLEFASFPGRECRVVIELGRQSPAALFGKRRF